MTIQTIELSGKRYVIMPEGDFLELQKQTAPPVPDPSVTVPKTGKFREITPLKVGGIPASELLIRDRQ